MLTFKHTLLVNGLHSTLNLWAGYYFIWRIVLVTLHCGKKKKSINRRYSPRVSRRNLLK